MTVLALFLFLLQHGHGVGIGKHAYTLFNIGRALGVCLRAWLNLYYKR